MSCFDEINILNSSSRYGLTERKGFIYGLKERKVVRYGLKAEKMSIIGLRKVWTETEKKLNEGHRERNGLREKDVKCWTADRKVVTNGLQVYREESDMDC